MSKISSGANYIQRDSSTSKRLATVKKSPFGVIFSAFFALVLMIMTGQPLVSSLQGNSLNESSNLPVVSQTQAAGISFICSDNMGTNMNSRGNWKSFLSTPPQYEAKNRSWTAEEAFGNQIGFITYHGEGEGNNYFVADKKDPNLDKLSKGAKEAYTKNVDKFKGLRTASNCVNQTIGTSVANIIMNAAEGASSITKMIVTFAFDSNVICEKPTDKGACINLLKVIGGTNDSSGGIIGTLTSGIYMPLLTIMAAITGFWVAKTGFKDKKYREALFGAIWLALSVILGLALLLKPTLLAKAPMAASNVVASCVIGAFNGQNCLTNSSTNSGIDINDTNSGAGSKNICRSEAAGLSIDENMSLAVNSLSCSIWKAFILEPLAQGNFGTSVENLDTTSGSPTSKVIEKAGLDPKDFCVKLSSTESASAMEGKRLDLNGTSNEVCNLLIYQGYLQTDAKTSTDKIGPPKSSNAQDPRWYNIATVAATDSGMWNQWGSSYSGGVHKTGIALLALFTSFLGGFILIVVAIFALIYYFSGVLLMAFAPIFLLIGVHPGRGKKILFGWLEKVISNVVKYIMSAVFLIVAIALYAAVLGNASNMGTTLVFILILSGALFLYRKELIDLIGKTNMGGEQISSKLSERLGGMVKGTAKLGAASAGAGLGAGLAGGRVSSGMKDGFKRSLQRGDANEIFGKGLGGVVTQATRQYSRNVVDNAQDIKTKARQEEARSKDLKSQYDSAASEESNLVSEIGRIDNDSAIKQVELDRATKTESVVSDVNNDVAREMQADNPYFGQAMLMLEQLKGLKLDLRVARINGDEDEMRRINGEIESVTSQRAELMDKIPESDLRGLNRRYKNETRRRYSLNGIDDYNPRDRVAYEELVGSTYKDQAYRDDLVERANLASQKKAELEGQWTGAQRAAELYSYEDINRQPGDDFNTKYVEKIDDKADALRKQALDESLGKGAKVHENKDLYDLGVTSYRGPDTDDGGYDGGYDGGGDDDPYNSGNNGNKESYNDYESYNKQESYNEPEVETTPIPDPQTNRNDSDTDKNTNSNTNEFDRSNYREYERDEREPYEEYDSERENYYNGRYDEEMRGQQSSNDSVPEPVRPRVNNDPINQDEDVLPDFNTPVNTPKVQSNRPVVNSTEDELPDYGRDTASSRPEVNNRTQSESTIDKAPRVNETKFRQEFVEELSKMSSEASREFSGTKFEKEFEQIYGKLEQISRSNSGDMNRIQSELEKVSLASDKLQDKINNASPEDLGPIADQMRGDIDNRVSELFDQKASRIEAQSHRAEAPVVDSPRVESNPTVAETARVEPVRPETSVKPSAPVEPKIPQSVINSAVDEAVKNATKNLNNSQPVKNETPNVASRNEPDSQKVSEPKRPEAKPQEPKVANIPSELIDEAVAKRMNSNSKAPKVESISKEQYEDIKKSIMSEMKADMSAYENSINRSLIEIEAESREVFNILNGSRSEYDFETLNRQIQEIGEKSGSEIDYREYNSIIDNLENLKYSATNLPDSIQDPLMRHYETIEMNFTSLFKANEKSSRAKRDADSKIRKAESRIADNQPKNVDTNRIRPITRPNNGLPINPNFDE